MESRMLRNALTGRGAHLQPVRALAGLPWEKAGERPAGSPHTIWQILSHMNFWQDFMLAQLRGANPPVPEHASESWPSAEAPESEAEWLQAVEHFTRGLDEAMRHTRTDLDSEVHSRAGRTRAETLSALALHNSYHAGQVVLLRRMLGAWPPPGGGDTW